MGLHFLDFCGDRWESTRYCAPSGEDLSPCPGRDGQYEVAGSRELGLKINSDENVHDDIGLCHPC